MRLSILANSLLAVSLVCICLACGGTTSITGGTGPQPAVTGPIAGLPDLPSGNDDVRESQLVDGFGCAGSSSFDSRNATPQGSELLLESGTDPANFTAWAIYQLPEFPTDDFDMVLMRVQYLDPDPAMYRPEEGYWVGYADYAKGQWVLDGPYRVSEARVSFPPEVEVASPGENYYIMVLVCQGNSARVEGAAIGGYTALGYEEYWLGRPPGHSMGQKCDIQLDPSGQPQIAHFDLPYALNMHFPRIRVSTLVGDSWEYTEIDPGYEPEWLRFAIGDGGRRAVITHDGNDLWLYYDDGGGAFADTQQLASGFQQGCLPSVVFVNAAGDPSGDLDTALICYATPDGGVVQTNFRTYDGALLAPELPLIAGTTAKPGRIALTPTAGKQAIAAVPDEIVDMWYCHVGLYTIGIWDFGTIPDWGPLDDIEDGDSFTPDIVVRETPDGDLNGCYIGDNGKELHLARYHAPDWSSGDQDVLHTELEPPLSMGTFGSGRAVMLSRYSDYKPMLWWGMPGAGEEYGRQYLDADSWAAIHGSLAVDALNSVHIAAANVMTGELHYFLRPPSGPVTRQLVDNGGMMQGGSAYYAFPQAVGDSLHVFYVNSTHPGILHSENVGGKWVVEGEVISTEGVPYVITGVGYLEDLDLLYVGYIDYSTLMYVVVSGTPGGGEWVSNRLGLMAGPGSFIADDETNVALGGMLASGLGEPRYVLTVGHPQGPPYTNHTITYDLSILGSFVGVAYDRFHESWGMITGDNYNRCVTYFAQNLSGNWTGPYIIAQELGPGASIKPFGLSYRASDGAPYVVVVQQASGDPKIKAAVHTAPPGGTDFHPLPALKEVDETTHEMQYAAACASAGGEPVVAVISREIAEPDWDIEFLVPSGSDTWDSFELWESPLMATSAMITVNADGWPSLAAVEMAPSLEEYGRVMVYYPW